MIDAPSAKYADISFGDIEFNFTVYYRHGIPTVIIDTPGVQENCDGPILRVQLNDDDENPIWENEL